MTGIFLFFNRTRSVFLEYFDDRGRSKEVPTRGLPEDGHRARPQPQPNRDGVTSMQSNSSDPKRYLSRYRHNSGLIDRSKVGPYNAKQRIVSLDELDSGKVVYPVDLIPHATHPRVLATIAEDPALLRRLQHASIDWFNWFTSHLEHRFVNDVLLDIKDGADGLILPDMMRLDAREIYFEEAEHASVADELSFQIGKANGESPTSQPRPEFFDRISRIEGQVSPELGRLVRLLFVIGTETSITGVLSKLPKNEEVVTAVRDVIRDHSVDEAKHSSYFTDVFEHVWPQLPSSARRTVGPLLPEIVAAFLRPDRRSVEHHLASLGLTAHDIEQVYQETYPEAAIRVAIADSAAGTLAFFRRNDVFKDPNTLDAFHNAGLLGAQGTA
jgi:hypothetical protein